MILTAYEIEKLMNLSYVRGGNEVYSSTTENYQGLIDNGLVEHINKGESHHYNITVKGQQHVKNLCGLNIQIGGNEIKPTNVEVLKKLIMRKYAERYEEMKRRGFMTSSISDTYTNIINALKTGEFKFPGEIRGRYADYLKQDFKEGWYTTVKVNGNDELVAFLTIDGANFLRMNTNKWGGKELTKVSFIAYSDVQEIKIEELWD